MKIDMTEIADRAVREAFARHRESLVDLINALADESGVIVNGVRHVNAARLIAAMTPAARTRPPTSSTAEEAL